MEKTYEVKVRLRFKGNPSDRSVLEFVADAITRGSGEDDAKHAWVDKMLDCESVKVNTISVTKHLDD